MVFRFLEDTLCISTIERTKNAPWGLAGGRPGRANAGELRLPDGTTKAVAKAAGLPVPKGSVFTVRCGGGGGYGAPPERDHEAVLADVREGYVTGEAARRDYPHAFTTST
jgi:N-methylhydantoinase B